MKTIQQIRYNTSPRDARQYNTVALRDNYLIEKLFGNDESILIYTYYDRMIIGGLMPVNEELPLIPMDIEKAGSFLQRREMGIINVGSGGKVKAGNAVYSLDHLDALYLGLGTNDIAFSSDDPSNPAKFYINSCLAHACFPSKKISSSEARQVPVGSAGTANDRVLHQYIVPALVETCQLMMGVTKVKPGSVWNTMPCHLHTLRMEAYFYFDIPEGHAVCHFMGEPSETRHIWMHNNQAVLSPSWSIHSAAGTSNYSFIWGMAGSDSPVDPVQTTDLR